MKIRYRRRALQLCLALFVLTIPVQPAYGHAEMVNAKPTPGSELSELPKSVEVVFAEEL